MKNVLIFIQIIIVLSSFCFQAVLQEVLKYRHQHVEFYALTPSASKLYLEYVTWTSCLKLGNLQSALRTQQSLSARRARRAPVELRGELKTQAASLAAAALELAKERVDAFVGESKRKDIVAKEFAQIRSDMINPLGI